MAGRITLILSLLLPSLALAQTQQTTPVARSERPPRAQTLTQIVPGIPVRETSFMIVVDDLTFENCKSAIMDYKRTLERGGLPAFVLSAIWNDPEEVKQKIMEFHAHSHLEGVVLIGDIPVPMIQTEGNRQSAFPSDRLYDTFDLNLEPVGSEDNTFYYRLPTPVRPGGPASLRIRSQIYSGRIKPLDNGTDPYQQINEYLTKAITAHQEENKLDQIFSYQGVSDNGVLADCLVAWHPRTARLNEQFPGIFRKCGQARFLRYDFWENAKPEVINQLRRENLDVAVIYGQTNIPAEEIGQIAPNVRFMIFDRYSEGRISDHTAHYLFAPGKTVTALSGVNTPHMVGLLGLGARIGQWVRLNNTLKTSIVGDPAFRFALPDRSDAQQANELLADGVNDGHSDGRSEEWLNDLLGDRMAASELRKIADTHPWPDVQNAALTQLFLLDDPGISDLLKEKFLSSPFAVVRLGCLELLGKQGTRDAGNVRSSPYSQILQLATTDRDELIRRTAISEMANSKDPAYVPFLIQAYLDNRYASAILSDLKAALQSYSPSLVKAQCATIFSETGTGQETRTESRFGSSERAREEFLRWAAN